MDRRRQTRGAVAAGLIAALQDAVDGSIASLRGSMASGRADAYSDIDLLWVVPDGLLEAGVRHVSAAVEVAVGPLVWVRSDPDLDGCERRRILSLRFERLPIFWRVDLDIRMASVAGDDGFGLDDPTVRGPLEWPAASALENAVAAVKLLRRAGRSEALGLLQRGFARIDEPYGGDVSDAAALRLACAAAGHDPSLSPLAAALRDAATER